MKRFALLVGILILSSGVFASISISPPLDIYNLGDRLYIDLNGLKGAEDGNLDINLKCGNVSVNMVRIPARAFAADKDQTYSVPYKILNREDLGILDLKKILGKCQIVASLGGETASSKSFDIKNSVDVKISSDKTVYNPGEVVAIDINAVKSNGANLDGFFEVANLSSVNGEIKDGKGAGSFVIGKTLEAGVYSLNVHAYDASKNGVLNEGDGEFFYSVNQIATSLVLSLSDAEIVPGNNLTFGLNIFDQSGVDMAGSVSVKIVSSAGKEINNVINSGESFVLNLPSNSSVGTWNILAEFNELAQSRGFEVMTLQKVDFDFEDSVLVVRNVGNVLYNKSIDVNIGEDIMHLDLKIGVGEVRKFSLKAPMGTYDVIVGDGEYEVTRSVLLTGNAVSVSDFKSVGIFRNYSIVWIFLIVVLGGIGGVMWMRYRKTKTLGEEGSYFRRFFEKIRGHKKTGMNIGKKVGEKVPLSIKSRMDDSLNFTKKSPAVHSLDSNNYSHEDKTMVDLTRKNAVRAESSLVLKGEKHVSAVVALNIKNYEEGFNDVAKQGLINIVENFKGKGLIDYRNEYIFVVFSPIVTRTYHNEILAVQSAMKILENLTAYNKKFKDKIEFGIGVHAGEMIASKESGRLKYTGIGNTISFAKRMSDVDNNNVVVSEVVKKKLIRDLKVLKGKSIGETSTYIVSEIMDRSGDAERLKQLMARSK